MLADEVPQQTHDNTQEHWLHRNVVSGLPPKLGHGIANAPADLLPGNTKTVETFEKCRLFGFWEQHHPFQRLQESHAGVRWHDISRTDKS
jgi:hypothetical protein